MENYEEGYTVQVNISTVDDKEEEGYEISNAYEFALDVLTWIGKHPLLTVSIIALLLGFITTESLFFFSAVMVMLGGK